MFNICDYLGNRLETARFEMRLREATSKARKRLTLKSPLRVLVDNSTFAHGRVFTTGWHDTGVKKWGPHEIATGFLGPTSSHLGIDQERIFDQVRYLIPIAYLAHLGHIQLFTSFELRNEQFFQPVGRYSSYGYFDLNLFSSIEVLCIDCHEISSFDIDERPKDRLRRINVQPFRSIVDIIGEKNNVDAWHIHTAETHSLEFFLHIDFPLDEELRKNRQRTPIATLKTAPVLPKTFAEEFELDPILPKMIPRRAGTNIFR